ncbi:hypothetical protein AMTR_s00041p00121820 [Amborella trichopoda]|uniref:Oligopeptide transporter OPT family protein n=1 Tax=Amborella trichopoda TaxID=13333 RepID=W1PZ04_AMBTC|nr:hypothetical protein AMTR_s00041p00121820 [Amborella trichopoda]
MLTSLSWICWIFPKSVFGQQLGSGLHGLGLGAIGIDWSTISSYLGSALASPWFATVNVAAGFFLFMYVITPLSYWLDLYHAKRFPIFSESLFRYSGQKYNITAIIDTNFNIDLEAYEREGKLYLSSLFAMTYGVGFASLTATLDHYTLVFFSWREIWQLSKSAFQGKMDVHTKIMSKYKQVPEWWFMVILMINIAAATFACEYYIDQLQMPWWGVLLACGIAICFTLPIGIISMKQAVTFLQDFKLCHYMKIPPRTMLMAQVVGTMIAAMVYLGTAWWLMNSVPNICNTSLLPSNSPWRCPMDHVFYDASVEAIAPLLVWLAHHAFPDKEWIRLINMPVLIGALIQMPPATAVNYTSWILMGFFSNFVLYRYRRDWWQRYSYILSGALDAVLAFMGVLLYLCLGLEDISLKWWGSELDGCPLASCPTVKGVVVEGCPVY